MMKSHGPQSVYKMYENVFKNQRNSKKKQKKKKRKSWILFIKFMEGLKTVKYYLNNVKILLLSLFI